VVKAGPCLKKCVRSQFKKISEKVSTLNFIQVKTEELRETLAEKCFNELKKACSPSGGKNLADEMSDLKSRQDTAICKFFLFFVKITFFLQLNLTEKSKR